MHRCCILVFVAACGPHAATSGTGPGTAAVTHTDTIPAPAACAGVALPALGWGEAAYDPAMYLDPKADLTPTFPEVASDGGKVLAATPVLVDDDATEMLAVIGKGGDDGFDTSLGLFRCGDHAYQRVGTDQSSLTSVIGVSVLGGQPIRLPDGRRATSVRILQGFPSSEMVVYEEIITSAGVLGDVEVGRQTVAEGYGGDLAREMVIAGSGWFPAGDELWFLGVKSYRAPEEAGGVGLAVEGIIGKDGTLTRGLDIDPSTVDGWALFGHGALPAWCNTTAGARCATIPKGDADSELDGGHFRYDWFAGTWLTADAAKAVVPDGAGDWAYLGMVYTPDENNPKEQLEADGYRTEPPPGPDGKPPAAKLVEP